MLNRTWAPRHKSCRGRTGDPEARSGLGEAREPHRVKQIGSGLHLGSGRLRRGDAERLCLVARAGRQLPQSGKHLPSDQRPKRRPGPDLLLIPAFARCDVPAGGDGSNERGSPRTQPQNGPRKIGLPSETPQFSRKRYQREAADHPGQAHSEPQHAQQEAVVWSEARRSAPRPASFWYLAQQPMASYQPANNRGGTVPYRPLGRGVAAASPRRAL